MRNDICVFGGCSLDMMYYGTDLNAVPDKSVPGGKAANQAVAAARAGAKVTIITRLGKDEVGQSILDNLHYNGVFTNNVELVEGLKNDYAKIYINPVTKDNTIIREIGAVDSFTSDMIERYSSVLLNSKMVLCQLKVPKEVTETLIDFCYKNNKPIILTPCRPARLKISEGNNRNLIDKLTYITANEEECKTIFETEDIESCVKRYPNKLIVTLGKDGVIYFDGEEIQRIPAIDVDNLIDTTGAGDTFNGNLAYCLTHGYDLKDAVVRSQYASAMKIQKETAQAGMPFDDELDKFIKDYNIQETSYDDEFDLAYQAVLDASKAIEDILITTVKKNNDKKFVTDSDLMIEKIIVEKIIEKYPNDNLLTQESYCGNKISDRTWVLDPIDGTIHYMKNSIFWAIQLAFVDKGEIQFSIIYLPKLNEMLYCSKGKGAFLNGKRIETKAVVDTDQSVVEFCGTLTKEFEQKKTLLQKLLDSGEDTSNFMHINVCSVAFANLITGRTDALILSSKNYWDILPGIMLCKEVGLSEFTIGNLKIYTNNILLVKMLMYNIDNDLITPNNK